MEARSVNIQGLLVIQPKVFEDERGYFYEPYNKKVFSELGVKDDFVQDNQSCSQKGVLRGLHFQNPPYAQSKLLRIIQGAIWDVVVDIRTGSPTYGKHYGLELNASNKTMFYVPEGFAHGFLTLQDQTILLYKCSRFYNKPSEDALLWNDSDLKINWNIALKAGTNAGFKPILSEKDRNAKRFKDFQSQF